MSPTSCRLFKLSPCQQTPALPALVCHLIYCFGLWLIWLFYFVSSILLYWKNIRISQKICVFICITGNFVYSFLNSHFFWKSVPLFFHLPSHYIFPYLKLLTDLLSIHILYLDIFPAVLCPCCFVLFLFSPRSTDAIYAASFLFIMFILFSNNV